MELNRTKIKAIIFDLDGVLVNMPDGHSEALNNTLSMFGVKIEESEHYAVFNGLPTRQKVAMLEEQGRLPAGLVEIINHLKQRYTKEVIPKICVPDYSKIILLKYLKMEGIKLACCSNSMKETLHLMLKSAHLFEYFDLVLGSDVIKNHKPHPEIYLTAFTLLAVLPSECIVVEDAPYGIEAARASGAFVIPVRGVEDVHLSLFENIIEDYLTH